MGVKANTFMTNLNSIKPDQNVLYLSTMYNNHYSIMNVNNSSECKFIIFLVFSITSFCCSSGHAEDVNPSEIIPGALTCFNKDFIYNGCEDEYRLDQSGFMKVPSYATEQFCGGPCLVETQLVLNCIDNILPNFVFYNRATIKDIRYTLRAGCSYTSQRGNFNVGNYITNNGEFLYNRINWHISLLIAGSCFSVLY